MAKTCIKVAASKKAKAHVRCYTKKGDDNKPKSAGGGGGGGSTKSGDINGDYSKVNVFKNKVGTTVSDEEAILSMKASGIPGDIEGTVYISKSKFGEITVEVTNDDLYMKRRLKTKEREIENIEFVLKDSGKEKYAGRDVFKRQVDEASNQGYKKITTLAARGDGYNGYYTWLRLGYIPQGNWDNKYKSVIDSYNKKNGTKFKKVTDFLTDNNSRDFWKKEGGTFGAAFDLDKNSSSYKTFNNYLKEKGSN